MNENKIILSLQNVPIIVISTFINIRAKGMSLHKIPLFAWAVVITAVLLLLSLPVLAGGLKCIICKKKIFLCKSNFDITVEKLATSFLPLTIKQTGHVKSRLNTSKLGVRFFTTSIEKADKTITLKSIPESLRDTIVGLILGDLHVRKRRENGNTTLNFKQSSINQLYIEHLYSLFHPYCMTPPKNRVVRLGEKSFNSVSFDTLAYPAFNYYTDLFYFNKIKIVPSLIETLLTARGLAYWFMDDGGADRSGFMLYTNSFTLIEVELLVNSLKNKFDLNCSIHTRKHKIKKPYMIYIKACSRDLFISLIKPYIIPHFAYKLIIRGSRVVEKKKKSP